MMRLEEGRTGSACRVLFRVHFTDSRCLGEKKSLSKIIGGVSD